MPRPDLVTLTDSATGKTIGRIPAVVLSEYGIPTRLIRHGRLSLGGRVVDQLKRHPAWRNR